MAIDRELQKQRSRRYHARKQATDPGYREEKARRSREWKVAHQDDYEHYQRTYAANRRARWQYLRTVPLRHGGTITLSVTRDLREGLDADDRAWLHGLLRSFTNCLPNQQP